MLIADRVDSAKCIINDLMISKKKNFNIYATKKFVLRFFRDFVKKTLKLFVININLFF
jgi:hypothetical protein